MDIIGFIIEKGQVDFHAKDRAFEKAQVIFDALSKRVLCQVFLTSSKHIMVQVIDPNASVKASCKSVKSWHNLPPKLMKLKSMEIAPATPAEVRDLTVILGRTPRLCVEI